MSPSRRLTAILAADIAGYSRLMGADEEGTVRALRGHQAAVLPLVEARGGRVIDTAGDGLLVEFASAVEAVRCAVAIQQTMHERNLEWSPDWRMEYRIGVNLGDVINEGDRLYGDGVNVAARLESLAEPGGIAVSQKIFEEVRDKVEFAFNDLGEQALKNISRPVHAYALSLGRSAVTPSSTSLLLPDRPSLAVLPFQSMSSDPDQEFFADGIVEDITTALSRFRKLFVIARNSAFSFRGKAIGIRQIGKELGVQYVIEGSVRRLGRRVRITAQLVETLDANHVWAEQYDRDLDEIFDVQDEIVRSIAASIQTQILIHEPPVSGTRKRLDLTTWGLTKKAFSLVQTFTRSSVESAAKLAREAIRREPESALGYEALALAEHHIALMGYSDTREIRDSALRNVQRAIELDGKSETSHWLLGIILGLLFGQPREASAAIRRSIELNPNYSVAYGSLGTMLSLLGQPDEGIRSIDLSIRLNPRNPSIFFRYTSLSTAYFIKGDLEQALQFSRRSLSVYRDYWLAYAYIAIFSEMRGDINSASAAAQQVLRLIPHATLGGLAWHLPPEQMKLARDSLMRLGFPP